MAVTSPPCPRVLVRTLFCWAARVGADGARCLLVVGPSQAWGVVSSSPALMLNVPADARPGYPIVFPKGQVPCRTRGRVRCGQALFARFGDDDGRVVAAESMAPEEGVYMGRAMAGGWSSMPVDAEDAPTGCWPRVLHRTLGGFKRSWTFVFVSVDGRPL